MKNKAQPPRHWGKPYHQQKHCVKWTVQHLKSTTWKQWGLYCEKIRVVGVLESLIDIKSHEVNINC